MNKCFIGDCREVMLAYCAGVIDSDGTIGVRRSTYAMRVVGDSKQPQYAERVTVRQVEPHAVHILHSLFGGRLGRAKPSTKRGRTLFEWQVTHQKAANCLVELLPYLRIKVEQAKNCIALRSVIEKSKCARVAIGRGHAGSSPRLLLHSSAMEHHFVEAKRMNHVGV